MILKRKNDMKNPSKVILNTHNKLPHDIFE